MKLDPPDPSRELDAIVALAESVKRRADAAEARGDMGEAEAWGETLRSLRQAEASCPR